MILKIGLGIWALVSIAVLAGLTLSGDFTKIVLIIAYLFILVGLFVDESIFSRKV